MAKSEAVLAIIALAFLVGCEGIRREPLPYSPNYSRIGAGGVERGAGGGIVRKGYGPSAAAAGALVPDACITPDVTEQALFLPPGCANNLNLQLMAERQDDLLQGRQTGPAMAAPSVRAARRVIDTEPLDRRSQAPAVQDSIDTTGPAN